MIFNHQFGNHSLTSTWNSDFVLEKLTFGSNSQASSKKFGHIVLLEQELIDYFLKVKIHPSFNRIKLLGTTFQEIVWQELRKIPYGATVSYQEIAQKIGQPLATRAVANAIGKNPLAIIIPCHRVLRSNGDLGGFHWGIELKKELLNIEGSSNL